MQPRWLQSTPCDHMALGQDAYVAAPCVLAAVLTKTQLTKLQSIATKIQSLSCTPAYPHTCVWAQFTYIRAHICPPTHPHTLDTRTLAGHLASWNAGRQHWQRRRELRHGHVHSRCVHVSVHWFAPRLASVAVGWCEVEGCGRCAPQVDMCKMQIRIRACTRVFDIKPYVWLNARVRLRCMREHLVAGLVFSVLVHGRVTCSTWITPRVFLIRSLLWARDAATYESGSERQTSVTCVYSSIRTRAWEWPCIQFLFYLIFSFVRACAHMQVYYWKNTHTLMYTRTHT
jgi:hypothetical protein